MLEITRIKNDPETVIEGLQKRGLKNAGEMVRELLQLDQQRRTTQAELDATLAELNKLSRSIGQLMKNGQREEAEEAKQKTGTLKGASKKLGDDLGRFEEEMKTILLNLPNIPNPTVPVGNTDEDNEEILRHGEIPQLHDGAQPHWELIKKYDIIDFELGVKITGAGFPVYKGKGAKLQRALVNFFLREADAAGYIEIQPPVVVNADSGYGTGQLPDKEGQMYHVTEDDLYLIPTAEVPITNIYRDEILNAEDLPVKMTGFTPCFRREAGSWGAHVRGLNRLHQFDKVEIVQITKPEESYRALEEMSEYIQGLLKKLQLPYRLLKLCTGDLGFTSAITYDMEIFSAAQQKWLEVSSVSNFETYQANRLKVRMRTDQKPALVHTLNGSALALPRIVAGILENNQDANGITIPEVLRPFTGFDRID